MAENRLSDVLPWNLVADGYVTEVVPVFEGQLYRATTYFKSVFG